ncbi:MAG: NPCBM/NEW2 domain-containing protein [Bacteroidota bacterium]
MSRKISFSVLATTLLLAFLPASGLVRAQSIHTTGDTIFVQGSKYLVRIDRVSGIVVMQNSDHTYYTRFPLFAEPLPATIVSSSHALSWKIHRPVVEMTARDCATQQIFLKAALKFGEDAFEVRFGVLPRVRDVGYEVSVVNGSWPWGLGVDTSFARNPVSISGNRFHKGLGAHAYSSVKLAFKKEIGFRAFKAFVGIDDEVDKKGSVVFQVLADGKKVAESEVITGGQPPALLEADVQGARTVELVVTDAGDGEDNDHADWADARFISESGEPIYVSDLISDAQQGLRLFSFDSLAFDTAGWVKMFTPEPDVYYSNKAVMVEVRQDVDGQRFFAPAPLNLSFLTQAGWFSMGLCELPEATGFRFQKGHLFIPYPWSKMKLREDKLYWVTPICFTFNRSEWDAIEDYRTYLLRNRYISDIPIEGKQIAAWWMDPLICTWSEQCMDNAAQASPRFTSGWVKQYVLGQEKALGLNHFTVIIDDKWQWKYGDPRPDPTRFGDMRELIDWIHRRGHRVLLWWRCWYGERGSLPDQMGLLDNGYIDATHPRFEEYVKQAVKIMLGKGAGELNADGFKVDYIFDVRDPATAIYTQPSLGVGIKEVYRFARIWYREAKKVKKDCLITFSGPDPHFSLVQDMSRLNDAGRDSLQRQYRARVSALSLPNLLIDGDGADMFVPLADYHHVVSSAYGTPSLYNLTRFSDGPITEDMHRLTGNIFRLSALKKPGHPIFKSFGNWQYVRNNKIVAESFQDGTVFIVYPDEQQALLISTKQQDLTVPLHGALPLKVQTGEGSDVKFRLLPAGYLMIPNAQRGEVYALSFRKK